LSGVGFFSGLFEFKGYKEPVLVSNIDQDQMYRVFNMGIGMVLIYSPQDTEQLTKALPEAKIVGEVVEQKGEKRVIIR